MHCFGLLFFCAVEQLCPMLTYKCVCFAEWIKLKISGQQCEPLELDKEDRERIEEIKRELLLKNPIKVNRSFNICNFTL